MLKKILIILIVVFIDITLAKDYKVFFLGGQSNMVGYGFNQDLPIELNIIFDNVLIFASTQTLDCQPVNGKGIWCKLRPGYGEGFFSDGLINKYSDRFGIELSFSKRISELFPNEKIAIIKYARNGSSIDISAAGGFGCWEPDFNSCNGVNQYDHALETIKNALECKDIDGDGEIDKLIPTGIIWMQGESDATVNKDIALKYAYNLKRLMDLFRAAFRVDGLPVIIGRISDSHKGNLGNGKVWKFGDTVREEQMKYVENDKNADIVTSTDSYSYSDKWHYDSKGYIDLGIQFADKMYHLLINKK